MRNSMVVIVAVAAMVLAGLALRQTWAAREARSSLDLAVRERDALRERVASLEKDHQALAQENTRLQATAAAQNAPPQPGVPVMKPFTTALPRGRMPPPMAMMDSPEMRALMQVEQKGRLDGRYAALFGALRLPPDRLEKLKQLLVDKQNAMMDVLSVAHRQNLFESGNAADIPALMKREQEALDGSIRDLLGATAYEEYQDYERTRAQRGVVDQLASRLSYTDSPLTAQQSQALVDLLAAEKSTRPVDPAAAAGPQAGMRVAFSAGSGDTMVAFGPPGFGGDSAPVTDASISAAQNLLTAAQIAALQQIQAEQQAQQKMSELLRQSMPMPPGGPGGTATWIGTPAAGSTTTSATSQP